ncbi:hypothetical protein [Paenibacillus beijingensis]|uniref:hypothetical protein n=1 Tax=Paenibacillus beijingensis TaxID=1126833 RepID=UPI000A490789|nr:hypothetical protein [Paenibacillus beijingensis]
MGNKSSQNAMEDHALESVPQSERKGWLSLTWNTAGIVTSLIQLFFGVLVTFTAGIKIGLTAGVLVTIIGGLLGWAVGHIAFKSGLSSTVMSRVFGFGSKGSILTSALFGFMILGFLALENALLYKGFLFYFDLKDTLRYLDLQNINIRNFNSVLDYSYQLRFSACSQGILDNARLIYGSSCLYAARYYSFFRAILAFGFILWRPIPP